MIHVVGLHGRPGFEIVEKPSCCSCGVSCAPEIAEIPQVGCSAKLHPYHFINYFIDWTLLFTNNISKHFKTAHFRAVIIRLWKRDIFAKGYHTVRISDWPGLGQKKEFSEFAAGYFIRNAHWSSDRSMQLNQWQCRVRHPIRLLPLSSMSKSSTFHCGLPTLSLQQLYATSTFYCVATLPLRTNYLAVCGSMLILTNNNGGVCLAFVWTSNYNTANSNVVPFQIPTSEVNWM